MKRIVPLWLAAAAVAVVLTPNARCATQDVGNRPDRLEWFRDLGFGLFIHRSPDSQLGSVISAQVDGLSAGADEEYEFRAVVKHPLLTGYGEDKTIR